MGADLGGTKLLLLALRKGRTVTRRVPTGPRTDPDSVEREVRSFLARLGAPPTALGLALPCLVDPEGTVTGCDTFPDLTGWRAEETFADLRCPVRALNDADAALAEETHDLAPDVTAAIVLAGTWVGAAVRANGGPVRGVRGWAGELGSAPISLGDGHVTRLDHLAGGEAIARRLGLSGANVYERAVGGDREVLVAVREAGHALGLGLATLVNLLNPEVLVLGGGALTLPGYREAAMESAERWSLPDPWRACEVRSVRSGAEAVALGAAREAARALPT